MSASVVSARPEQTEPAAGARQRPAPRGRVRTWFYSGLAGVLLLIVLAGFSRTFYLRAFFDVPQMPAYLYAHGVVLTAWYGGLFLQTLLIWGRRTSLHRRLGWVFAAIGLAVVAVSWYVTMNFVPRQRGLGVDIDARLGNVSETVWTNVAQLLVFSVLVAAAVILRRRAEWHKRFMLLASIAIVSPALSGSRMGTLIPVFSGVGFGPLTPAATRFGALVLLVAGLALYDVLLRRRVHPATLVGGAALIAARILGGFVIADSEFGLAFVRDL